ncbi:MAG: GNAT family N-acetyltransferase [Gammaproteobacteria bacterium]|nr:GNAT family N-acetyltransferase [Gammaproteobacteria bacterium]
MNLRTYRDQDLDNLLEVWWDSWHSSSSFRHPAPIAAWKTRWENLLLTHKVIVVEDGETLIGFAAVEPMQRELSQIFVAPTHKGNGYGKVLFDWARGICGDSMKLKTLVENTEARSFYAARGMKEGAHSINDFNGMKQVVFTFETRTNAV